MDVDSSEADAPTLKFSESRSDDDSRLAVPVMKNFDRVRQNIREYSHGIFKLPSSGYTDDAKPVSASDVHALPPKTAAEQLLSQYFASIQTVTPLLHWPSFTEKYQSTYINGGFRGAPAVWMSLFFAVLACGTLQSPSSSSGGRKRNAEGTHYFEAAAQAISKWTDNLTLDHVRSAVLISVFLFESNLKSAGCLWLGLAVQISQSIGLHLESGPWSSAEAEERRLLWWAVFVRER